MISLRTTSLLCLAAALGSAGCVRTNATAPKTYAVKGKVVYSDGTPMTSGFIEFQSVKHPGLRTNAEIKKDGTFTLETLVDGQRLRGGPEGEHKVTITPMLTGDQTSQPDLKPIVLPKTYTIKAEDDNDLTITVEKPKR